MRDFNSPFFFVFIAMLGCVAGVLVSDLTCKSNTPEPTPREECEHECGDLPVRAVIVQSSRSWPVCVCSVDTQAPIVVIDD